MGSSGTSNPKDRPIIQRQQKKVIGGGGGGNSGGRTSSQDTCPAALSIKIIKKNIMEGTKVTLTELYGSLVVANGNEIVAELDKSRRDQLARCVEQGFSYRGKVVKRSDGLHAELIRTA